MPIEVHCPNPTCARIHRVKDRYAGMRGKCPACASWMYVPKPAKVIEIVEEVEDVGKSLMIDREVAREVRPHKLLSTPAPVESARADESPTDPSEKPKRRSNWLAAACMLLGILGLGAVSAAPYLEKPGIEATGEFAKVFSSPSTKGIETDYATYVSIAPATVAFLVLVSLITIRFGLASQLLLYVAIFASSAMLFLALWTFRSDSIVLQQMQDSIALRKASGVTGEAHTKLGMQLLALVGGTGTACASLMLAAILLHRRWWSRLFAFVFLGIVVALGPVWIYREELGIKGYLPELLEKTIPL